MKNEEKHQKSKNKEILISKKYSTKAKAKANQKDDDVSLIDNIKKAHDPIFALILMLLILSGTFWVGKYLLEYSKKITSSSIISGNNITEQKNTNKKNQKIERVSTTNSKEISPKKYIKENTLKSDLYDQFYNYIKIYTSKKENVLAKNYNISIKNIRYARDKSKIISLCAFEDKINNYKQIFELELIHAPQFNKYSGTIPNDIPILANKKMFYYPNNTE